MIRKLIRLIVTWAMGPQLAARIEPAPSTSSTADAPGVILEGVRLASLEPKGPVECEPHPSTPPEPAMCKPASDESRSSPGVVRSGSDLIPIDETDVVDKRTLHRLWTLGHIPMVYAQNVRGRQVRAISADDLDSWTSSKSWSGEPGRHTIWRARELARRGEKWERSPCPFCGARITKQGSWRHLTFCARSRGIGSSETFAAIESSVFRNLLESSVFLGRLDELDHVKNARAIPEKPIERPRVHLVQLPTGTRKAAH